MSILTERQTWKRKHAHELRAQADVRKLTPTQSKNVRRVLGHLAIELGGPSKLAAAMGGTRGMLEKARSPSRPPNARLALMAARVAGVDVDDVLAGQWRRHACDESGCVAVV